MTKEKMTKFSILKNAKFVGSVKYVRKTKNIVSILKNACLLIPVINVTQNYNVTPVKNANSVMTNKPKINSSIHFIFISI